MNKNLKYILFFILLWITSIAHWKVDFWMWRISSDLQWWWTDLVQTWTNIVTYLIWLMYLIAIVFWIYWWFVIITSGWADDKVKKWKKIILFVVIWLAVTLLSSVIVNWTISTMSSDRIIWDWDITTTSNK